MKSHFLVVCVVLGCSCLSCATTGRQWEKAQQADTFEAYLEFVHAHPSSEYSKQARTRIQDMLPMYLSTVKAVTIMCTAGSAGLNDGQVRELRQMLSKVVKERATEVCDSGALDRMIVEVVKTQFFSGTSLSYWHPAMTRGIRVTFYHKDQGPLFVNSYSEQKTDIARTVIFSNVGVRPIDPSEPTFLSTMGVWGAGVQFVAPTAGQGTTLEQETRRYDWDGLYPFSEFKEHLRSSLTSRHPLQVSHDTEFLF